MSTYNLICMCTQARSNYFKYFETEFKLLLQLVFCKKNILQLIFLIKKTLKTLILFALSISSEKFLNYFGKNFR